MSKALQILQQYWNYPSFRKPQEKIINAVLQGKDVVAVLPTGSGKSVIYQVSGLALGGLTLVISPLVALIEDQVNGLNRRGIKAISLSGNLSFSDLERLLDNAQYGQTRFLFLSPERLQNTYVQDRLQHMPVSLITVDEAHCISEWGHDFRPSYLKLGILRDLLPKAQILSLTATAKNRVIDDIKNYLQATDAVVFKEPVFRNNIAYKIYRPLDKTGFLSRYLSKNETAIVYVRTRKQTYQYADILAKHGFNTAYFHGGMNYEEKQKTLADWLDNKSRIIFATNAFGMGIDKPDVRKVVHMDLPASLENYVQESGRAGRDGKNAEALMLVNENDLRYYQKIFPQSIPGLDFVEQVYTLLYNYYYIAENEGENLEFDFDILDFCQRYKLNVTQTLNALQILDSEELVRYNRHKRNYSLVQILLAPEQVRTYIEKRYYGYEILNHLVRSYMEILRIDTKIHLKNIAGKLEKTVTDIHKILLELHRRKIIDYKPSGDVYSVLFLQNRDRYILMNHRKSIQKRIDFKRDQIRQVWRYAGNDKVCRSRFLSQYFEEENSGNCGICDICLSTQNTLTDTAIIEMILQELASNCIHKIQLQQKFQMNIQKHLDTLIENQVISLNNKQEYCLTKK